MIGIVKNLVFIKKKRNFYMLAAQVSRIDFVNTLIQAGVNSDMEDNWSDTALIFGILIL